MLQLCLPSLRTQNIFDHFEVIDQCERNDRVTRSESDDWEKSQEVVDDRVDKGRVAVVKEVESIDVLHVLKGKSSGKRESEVEHSDNSVHHSDLSKHIVFSSHWSNERWNAVVAHERVDGTSKQGSESVEVVSWRVCSRSFTGQLHRCQRDHKDEC